MPPSGNGVIANAVIEVSVDRSKIKAGFNAAAQETRTESQKVSKAAQVDTGLLGTARDIKQFTKPVREFREAIQGTLGAVLGFAGTAGIALTAVTAMVAGMREFWKMATNVVTASDRMGNSVAGVASQGERLQQRLAALSKQNKKTMYGFGAEDYKDLVDDQRFEAKKQKQVELAKEEAKAAEARVYWLGEAIKRREDQLGKDPQKRAMDGELRDLNKQYWEALQKSMEAKARIDKPQVVQQREALFSRIKLAEAQDVADEAEKLDKQTAQRRMTEMEKSYADEQDAFDAIQKNKEGATQETLDSYNKLEQAMRRFYQAERDEIKRNEQLRLDAAMNAIKQSNIDSSSKIVTSIENLGQQVLRIEQGIRGLK